MKIVLAGAFHDLGCEILKLLCDSDHEIVAADSEERPIEGCEGKYTFFPIDTARPKTLEGLCEGADICITTLNFTGASLRRTPYDIDYRGNMNIYKECIRAGVRKFNYVSIHSCNFSYSVRIPFLYAKYMVVREIQSTIMDFVIYRPTAYFSDIAQIYKGFAENGEIPLLKGYEEIKTNAVDCSDLAEFIVDHMQDENKIYDIGGKETYSYQELADMFSEASGKSVPVKLVSTWKFGFESKLPKDIKSGNHDILIFLKWVFCHDRIGDTEIGSHSFKQYITESFKN